MINQCYHTHFYFGFTYIMLNNAKFDMESLLVEHINSMLNEKVIKIT
jgi:hypothetical protein